MPKGNLLMIYVFEVQILTQKIKFNLLYGSKICVKLLFKKARSFKSYLFQVHFIHSNQVIWYKKNKYTE